MRAHHEKGPLLGIPLNSALETAVRYADRWGPGIYSPKPDPNENEVAGLVDLGKHGGSWLTSR